MGAGKCMRVHVYARMCAAGMGGWTRGARTLPL